MMCRPADSGITSAVSGNTLQVNTLLMIPSDSRKESNPIYVNKCSEFK